MIEVKGTDEIGQPQVISFDGRVFEIFGWIGGKMSSRRYHVDHLKKIEIQERDDKPPLLNIELKFPVAFGTYEFKSGGENLHELVDAVKQEISL